MHEVSRLIHAWEEEGGGMGKGAKRAGNRVARQNYSYQLLSADKPGRDLRLNVLIAEMEPAAHQALGSPRRRTGMILSASARRIPSSIRVLATSVGLLPYPPVSTKSDR
jgi:hypothetical protein